MTLTLPHYEPTGSVVALLSATSHQGNPDSSVAALLSATSLKYVSLKPSIS
jgi:hypothetical protein